MPTYNPKNVVGDAARIAREVLLEGRSSGWSGGLDELEALRQRLRPHGIAYVDDMHGEWGRTAVGAAEILAAVKLAMQPAEELGGPEGEHYVALMRAIADEALSRIAQVRS